MVDGLASLNSDATTISGTTIYGSSNGALNGHVFDFGTFLGSGNTTVVTYARTFTAAPSVFCFPTIGSHGVAVQTVVSAQGTGSFSAAAGSNYTQYWIAVGSGTI